MPLTPFQRRVLEILVRNRSEASHFAGGLVLNAAEDSARYSHDFDVFHDAVEDLVRASEQDVRALEAAGVAVERINRDGAWDKPVSFRKAIVRDAEDKLELDWAHDSAFRFFPIVPDPLLGWRLHLFDIAMHDRAREEMTLLANERIDMPIGVAFVDGRGEPGWIRRDPALRIHHPTLRGCFPSIAAADE